MPVGTGAGWGGRHMGRGWLGLTQACSAACPPACRYVPVGLLERLPQRINERPPYYLGRDYLETLMASQKAADWIRIRCLCGLELHGWSRGPGSWRVLCRPWA